VLEVALPVFDVDVTQPFRDQSSDVVTEELLRLVTEELAEPLIRDEDPALFVDDGDAVRRRLE
jgi:hypothetical protein